VPVVNSSQMPKMAWHLAGCHLTAPRQLTTLVHRSGLQHALACLLCRLLTSAGRSGRIAPPSVLYEDTPQISRGKRSYLLCIDAGLIKYAPTVDGGLCGCVPTRPERTTPQIRFVSLAPHIRSTLPSDPASRRRPCASLVLRLHVYLDRGLSPPSMTACTAHTPQAERRAIHRVRSSARLCENLEFWHFRRCKLLISLRCFSEKSSFHTVWRLVRRASYAEARLGSNPNE
jgi:hypothetical protein